MARSWSTLSRQRSYSYSPSDILSYRLPYPSNFLLHILLRSLSQASLCYFSSSWKRARRNTRREEGGGRKRGEKNLRKIKTKKRTRLEIVWARRKENLMRPPGSPRVDAPCPAHVQRRRTIDREQYCLLDDQPAHPFSFFGRRVGKVLWTSGNLRLTVSSGVTRNSARREDSDHKGRVEL